MGCRPGVPAFVLLFMRIHAYYQRAGLELGVGSIPTKPVGRRTLVIVPVTSVSRLTEYALAEALSMGQEVVAVSVAMDPGGEGLGDEELRELGRSGTRTPAAHPAHRFHVGGRTDRRLHR